VTRGQLPQRAGSLGLNGGGTAAAVPPEETTVVVVSTMSITASLRHQSLIIGGCREIISLQY